MCPQIDCKRLDQHAHILRSDIRRVADKALILRQVECDKGDLENIELYLVARAVLASNPSEADSEAAQNVVREFEEWLAGGPKPELIGSLFLPSQEVVNDLSEANE